MAGAVGAGAKVLGVAAVGALAVAVMAGGAPASAPGPPVEVAGGVVAGGAHMGETTAPSSGGLRYRVPVVGIVEREFDAPEARWAAGHRGVDLAAAVGAAVGAPADGRVTFAGTVVDRGTVTVTHPDGRRSSLEPVVASVAVGDAVAAGDVVGTVQDVAGHCAPRACLHWGVREGDRYVDPLGLLPGRGPVVLLPDR